MSQVVEEPPGDRGLRPPESLETLEAGRAAFARNDWGAALELLAAADDAGRVEPADLDRLAESAWWSRQLDRAIRYRERAYKAHLRAAQKGPAAGSALALVLDYVAKLKMTLATSALRRAQRLLAEEPEGSFHAQLAAVEGLLANQQGEFDRATQLGQRAREIARQHGVPDIEIMGLLVEGSTRVAKGEVDEGLALLDEATSAAVGGEISPMTTGIAYCITIGTCRGVGDFDRARQWTDAAEMWCEQEDIPSGFPGLCRVHRAEVKHFQGAWSEAEEEAARAAEELMNFSEDVVGAAYYEIGAVRLKRGDFDGAEEAFRAANQFLYDPQPGIALLRLARGEIDAAASSINRALAGNTKPLDRVRMLPAQVHVAIAAGDLETAQAAALELEEIAENYRSPSPVLKATAAHARAELHVAQGKPEAAARCADAALQDWRTVGAPYETAMTRVVLADAYVALGDLAAAEFELEAAIGGLDKLGAQPDARAARERLADLTKPEQVTRTFMFTDVVRSTRFIGQVGEEAWVELLRVHDRTLRGLFAEFSGEEIDHAGDGFFVAFSDAAAAIDCAIAIQRALAEEGRFGDLKVRVGVHTVRALRHGRAFRGTGVHAAARIAAKAGGGEVLASRETVEAAGRAHLIRASRTERLKDIPESVELVSLARAT